MDAHRFDVATKRLAGVLVTRSAFVRGFAAGSLVLGGLATASPTVEAKRKKKALCHCGSTPGGVCTTERVSKKQRKRHLRDDQCDYLGACRNTIDACAAVPITLPQDVLNLINLTCPLAGCGIGLTCGAGNVCLPLDLGQPCSHNSECSTGNCDNHQCALCVEVCGLGNGKDPQCCASGANCVADVCVL